MATLIAYQDGDFTGATTFKALVGGTGSAQETITASTNTTTAYVSSSAFTVTNTHVIEGVMVHCRRLNTTGTVSVALSDDNGVTATREVTVDASDLPDQNSWVFFKFGTTLTGDGGADYKVMVKGSSANNAVFFRDATAGNWARLLRRDSTATIATTDVVYISGERTGAGSVTSVTVTMDQTATTSYGAMNIGDAGTVSYGTSASTNYYLRLAGNLNVFGNGTLNIGTSDANPIDIDGDARVQLLDQRAIWFVCTCRRYREYLRSREGEHEGATDGRREQRASGHHGRGYDGVGGER